MRSLRQLAVVPLAVSAVMLLGSAPPAMVADTPLLTWPDLTGRPRPRFDASFSYGPDLTQRVDLWLPAGPGPHPLVVMVHGGCWTSSIADRGLMNWIAADLRASGIAVWNIDYRGVDRPGGGYPGTFLDAANAADLLRAKAAEHHLELRHIVVVGHSAGGHLALWLAARPHLPATTPLRTPNPLRVSHVVVLGGLPDLEATAQAEDNGCGTEVVARLTGGHFADTSIPRLLPLGIPQDLVNGREDRIIPYRLAIGYRDQAVRAGDRVELHTVPHTGHVELIAPGTAAWAETKRLIVAALRAKPNR